MASEAAGSALTLRIAQVALLVRLVVLFVLALVWTVQGRGLAALAVMAAAIFSYAALRFARARRFLTHHPLAVLLDALLLALVVGAVGVDTPFALALGTSALLIGLWLPFLPGAMVMGPLLAVHLTLLTRHPMTEEGVTAFVLLLPATLVTLWLLGLAIQRSARAQEVAQAALRDAMAVASASQERGRIAREMHDTVAKSLQAMALTASALPTQMHRRPEVAAQRARELEQDCTDVIGQVRALMRELRAPLPEQPFDVALAQVVDEWRSRTGRRCITDLAKVAVSDGLVRYELLMVTREALANVHAHAGRCLARVSLHEAGDVLTVVVSDDGVGADAAQVTTAGERGHFGVLGMRERMAQVGGSLTYESAPGHGTTVTCQVHRRGLIEKELMTR